MEFLTIMNISPSVWVLLAFSAGGILGYAIRRWRALNHQASSEKKAQEELESAKKRSQEIVLEAEKKAAGVLATSREEERVRKEEARRFEHRLQDKEDSLERQKNELENEAKRNREEQEKIKKIEEAAKNLQLQAVKEIEKIAGLTKEEAKSKLISEMEESHKEELARALARLERERRDEIEKKSSEIIVTALQRYARSAVADSTTSVVHITSDELKGKIIGREGRNIKTFERLTGVEVVIDDTPDTILLSSFDPMRREVAKIALEKLIKDGRIQPAKIEEKVEEAKQELDEAVRKAGEEAAYEVGILDLPKEIVFLLGRLNYRTSYGQNVLHHSIEMSHVAGMLATELGLNVEVAKRGALLHDIGKAIDHEVEGTHVEIGRKLLKKYGIDEKVIQAMEAHHEEYPYAIPEAYIVSTADAISGARPGARRDTLEKYLKRLEEIERVVNSFSGIQQSYAVSAGREVRVFVTPEKIDDFGALQLAKEIAGKIQSDIQYPGEIKVTVIREVKAIEFAR